MSRRERLEARTERRREWAAKRDAKANSLRSQGDAFRGDHAFNTQPGHIPERARMIRRDEQAYEHGKMAQHHREKAGGLEDMLDRSVFSDDSDAIEKLEARIKEHEEKRDRMKKINSLYRKGDADGLKGMGLELETLRAGIAHVNLSFVKVPYEGWQLTNLGARIRTNKKRIEEIKRSKAQTEKAENAGGVLIEEHGEYSVITFAEKPDRSVLDSLKAAGFRWGGGHWLGKTAALPAAMGTKVGA